MSFLRDYAEALLIEPCMVEKGFVYQVPWQPIDRGSTDGYAPGGQRLFNTDIASKYGYHRPERVWENKEAWRQFGSDLDAAAAATAGYDDALVACREAARKEAPLVSDDAMYYAADAISQSYSAAISSPESAATLGDWRECMNDSGMFELTDNPEEMPTPDRAEQWQISTPGTVASTEEIALATADASCAASSGWTSALYNAQWAWQERFLNDNQAKLQRIGEELDANRSMLERIVVDNAPSR
ncbi:hypothetical protein [Microbacterium sp. RURRCA19A]|uniref:hypothetical protein n=1 Tax=Microbacterium sp. RURRCA19A TaxID=1907391 RepID=UPI00111583AC|nr:hypothetical protein [Microbacterium sp. RURRCA19A]